MAYFGPITPRYYPYSALSSAGHVVSKAHWQGSSATNQDFVPQEPLPTTGSLIISTGLIAKIWELAYGHYPTRIGRRAIARQLSISKAAFEQLAPLVWRQLDDHEVPNLLNLLVPEWYEYGGHRAPGNDFLFILRSRYNEILYGHAFKKFLWYASHVHSLSVSPILVPNGTFGFIALMLEALSGSSRHSERIFTRVRHIQWTDNSQPIPTTTYDLQSLPSPATVYVYIQTYDFAGDPFAGGAFLEWMEEICEVIAEQSPRLKYLGVEAIRNIFNNPLRVSPYDGFSPWRIQTTGSFELNAAAKVWPFGFRQLESLQLASWMGSAALFKSLTSICPSAASSLRTLDLQSLVIAFPQNPKFLSVIQPLLLLHLLERVSMNFPNHRFSLSDSDLRKLAAAWPHLIQLGIGFSVVACESMPEIGTIGFIATMCPKLESITIPFWSLPYRHSIWSILITPPSNHPLKEIRTQEVDWVDIDQVGDKVANCLHTAFPHLQTAVDDLDLLRREDSEEPINQAYIMRSRLNKLSLRVWTPSYLQYDVPYEAY